jgi:predicted HTH transcriptional regulator
MSYPKEKLIEITKRVYRLTQLFPKKEPLRYKIREIADEILANLLRETKNPTIKDWEILDSFFEIAKEQNWVSPREIFQIQQDYKNLFQEIHSEPTKDHSTIKKDWSTINERQKKILEILKEKGEIQVGQVKEFFPNVSKRTLRRDFQSLVKKGIIERIGEKNKTFYQLKWKN